MTAKPEIRNATAADLPALLPLLAALFAIERDFAFDAAKARAGLELILAGAGTLVVAEAAGRIVGMGSLQALVSTAEGGPVGLIEDVVVADSHRGTGTGRRLIEALMARARALGHRRVQLLADRTNDAGLAFYERLGWRETNMICLRLGL